MLKSYQYPLSLLQRTLDAIGILSAWMLAYFFRFDLIPGGQPGLQGIFLQLSLATPLLFLYVASKIGLYKSYRYISRSKEISDLLKANTISFIGLILVFYFFFGNKISRVMLLFYFLFSHLFLITLRISVRNFLRHLRKKEKNLRHILLIGNGSQTRHFVEAALKYKEAGLNFLGWMDSDGLAQKYHIPELALDLSMVREKYNPDGIVVGYGGEKSQKVSEVLKKCYNDVVPIQVLPDLSYAFIGHEISEFAGLPIITINRPRLSFGDFIIKRTFDFLLSLIGILLLSPLLLLIALLVKLTSKGPVFYGQERMGLDGRHFTMWKYRSMRTDAEIQSGAVWAVQDDPRRTPIGKFLRVSSLDELPQLWNVLIGDMSLVGPRPERPVFVEKFRHEIPTYMLRHKVKAGITGWAQINGWRGNTSLERRIEFDIYYIKNWSLFLDLKILVLTFWKGVFNKNAY